MGAGGSSESGNQYGKVNQGARDSFKKGRGSVAAGRRSSAAQNRKSSFAQESAAQWMSRMSTAAGGTAGTAHGGGGGVDWDSVLNLTMQDIRTKDIYDLRGIVSSDRYSDETREKVRRLIEHVEPPQQVPWEMIQLMNTYQLQDILDSASKFSKETVQLAAEFIDSLPYNERFPLHYAIYILDMEQVKDLLTEYSTINERDSSYWTPLHICTLIGGKGEKENRAQVVMARLLISLGSDIDAQDMFGRTPLWIAINKGYGILTRIFLERGANVNIGDNAGVYPFQLVEQSTYPEIRRLVPVLMKKVEAVRQGRGF